MKARGRSVARARFIAGGWGLLGAIAAIRPARGAEFVYRLGHPDATDYPPHDRLVEMSKAVEAETKGRMQIQVYANSQLGSTTGMLTQLRVGSIQFTSMIHSAYSSVVPVTQIESIGFAFSNAKQPLDAMDGALGAYIRQQFASNGLYAFERTFPTGFREITSSTKPIRTADDLAGFKVRTLPSSIYVDLFKTLGASPLAIDSNAQYVALQTHLADGVEVSLAGVEANRLYEVQKYVSMTNHLWSGYWVVANADAMKALPSDIQSIVERNMLKYILMLRRDMTVYNDGVAGQLKRQGLVFNEPDTNGMRARLGPYYERWKKELGATAWDLLEGTVGRLG